MTKTVKPARKGSARLARTADTGKFVSSGKVVHDRKGRPAVPGTVSRASRDAIAKGSKRFAKALDSLAKR